MACGCFISHAGSETRTFPKEGLGLDWRTFVQVQWQRPDVSKTTFYGAAVAVKGPVVVPDLVVEAIGRKASDHAGRSNVSLSCICGSSQASL